MPMNKQAGNMYWFVTHTWNAIRGDCPHGCLYCYMKGFNVGELRLEQKELKTNLGVDNYIFVGSSTDMFADVVPSEWIADVLIHCNRFPENTYLFQTKNPERFQEFQRLFPKKTVLGTTLETNADVVGISKAPNMIDRHIAMVLLSLFEKMVSIEPIMEFNLGEFVSMIKPIKPKFVSIGADSKSHGLLEPDSEKIHKLIDKLSDFTEVKVKSNMKRLMVI